jgi:hypothetical protein
MIHCIDVSQKRELKTLYTHQQIDDIFWILNS